MSLFSSADFKKLKFNPFDIEHGEDLLYYIKGLSAIESFPEYGNSDRNKVIRYIIYVYDPDSPFVKHYVDPSERKRQAIEFTGFNKKKDSERIEQLFDLTDEQVSDMIIDFLKYINIRKWTLICSNEQTLYEYQKALMTEVTSVKGDKDKLQAIDVKSKLLKDSDLIDERLDKYYRDVFGEGEMLDKVRQKRMTPESIAKRGV